MKQRINNDFLTAYKTGNIQLKTTLGGIKAAITIWETSKQNAGKTITDDDIVNILGVESKKRKDAFTLYIQEGSEKGLEKATKEVEELDIIVSYLPKQLSDEKVRNIVISFLGENILPNDDAKALRGMMGLVMKEFKTHYNGQYDSVKLKAIVEDILQLT